jgi:hypothetical protein
VHSRPDNTNGPSYASIDAQQNWFRGFQSEDTNLFFTSEANRSETVRSWMLLCGTVVAYAFMVSTVRLLLRSHVRESFFVSVLCEFR